MVLNTLEKQLQYIAEQPYFNQFIFNILNSTKPRVNSTIIDAFLWRDSKEGYDFWCIVHEDLFSKTKSMEQYNIQEIQSLINKYYPKNKYPEYYI